MLFPEPMHLTRRIDDPISGSSVTLDEYCAGNRIVTVRGRKVAITDYEKQQLTEIDHDAATYSITRFDEIARLQSKRLPRVIAQKATTPMEPRSLGVRASASGRSLDTFEVRAESLADKPTLQIGVDRSVTMSRDALDALLGAGYPNERSWQHDAITRAAAPAQARMQAATDAVSKKPVYALPADQSMTWQIDGRELTLRNAIIAVDNRPPPAALLLIPRGAKQVESHAVTTQRLLKELDLVKPGN
ncbi:MAG TPA: hypothetical protein VMS98_16635 [Thermoanaerobaculia bacterium]|nr:hypothetical protein [Thermoanaerobaculia bacterium]